MSKTMQHIIENGVQTIEAEHEPRIPEDMPEFNAGIWFQSSTGGWYRNKDVAQDIVAIRAYGKTYTIGKAFDKWFEGWWRNLDEAMQSDNPPFEDK